VNSFAADGVCQYNMVPLPSWRLLDSFSVAVNVDWQDECACLFDENAAIGGYVRMASKSNSFPVFVSIAPAAMLDLIILNNVGFWQLNTN
jgi:hypothetical protein